MALLRFGFTAVGDERSAVVDELDSMVQLVVGNVQGEPWVAVVDKIEMMMLDQTKLLTGAPGGYIYHGMREVVFTGPTQLGPDIQFGDGFRPQGKNDDFTL